MTTPVRMRLRAILVVVVSLAAVTPVIAVLIGAGVRDASEAYLLAVVATAVIAGAWPAVSAAFGAFLLYDILFVEPRYTLFVSEPQEWLNLILLLVIGIVVGRLAGAERDRAETAIAREREALAMFRISFALASAPRASEALPALLGAIQEVVPSTRAWIELDDRSEADTDAGPRTATAIHSVLQRRPGDRPATWARVHVPGGGAIERGRVRAAGPGDDRDRYRVAVATGDRPVGSIWLERERAAGLPTAGETRVLAAAADQIGRAVDRDRLADDAATAEVARRSDQLKSALLDSVSHDLRTPLASIRAAAGTLMDAAIVWSPDEQHAIATSIDLEADRLNRLVSNLLDMSRIEAGALRPTTSAHVLEDLVEAALGRSLLARWQPPVSIAIPADLAPVEVDDVLFEQVLANVLDNAACYAGAGAPIAIEAGRAGADDAITLRVEDGGQGVPDAAMVRLFEKFYRAPRSGEGSRRGTGAGLTVVRGLMEAMGGTATARRSALGGLAIDLRIPVAAAPGGARAGIPSPATEVIEA